MVSHLDAAIHSMTATHTIIFTAIGGGIWPQMIHTIIAAPALRYLVIEYSLWLEARDVVTLPMTLSFPLIRLVYMSPYALKATDLLLKRSKRPAAILDVEAKNLRSILRACHPTLESLSLPGELILLSVDPSLTWNSLRELFLAGYWPDRAEASLHSILLCLPNLRLASFHCHPPLPDEQDPVSPTLIDPIFSEQVLPTSGGNVFLSNLLVFEVASLLPHDRILSTLPEGLEKLSLIEFPLPHPLNRQPTYVLHASQLLAMLDDVFLPGVKHLELWYRTDASDEVFLQRLPSSFPSLQYLELHRFIGPFLNEAWNPAVG